jgi:hypothetical protein
LVAQLTAEFRRLFLAFQDALESMATMQGEVVDAEEDAKYDQSSSPHKRVVA